MASDASDPGTTLLEAVRIAARGGDLDTRLDQLAQHVRQVTGAVASAFYLYDPSTRILVPAGSDGLSEDERTHGQLTVDEADDALTRAVRERRIQVVASADAAAETPPLGRPFASWIVAPLLADDASGLPEIEGVLLAGFDAPLEATGPLEEQLSAIGDLAAVAVRHTRLEHALMEHADWLERIAHTDPLTGLANQRTFDRMVELEIARAARQGTALSLAVFDVDGLRTIRDQAGAEAADDVLRRVASALAESVRLVDTIARVGGDEFAVIAPGSGGGVVASRIRDAVAAIEPVDGTAVTVSSGVARFPEEGGSAAEVLAAAHAALTRAQGEGPGRVVVAGES